ncbi:unnamed protein product [Danaus chrysippus]|uniref:(African queen) hypothetical protein n=1 Tax=Danaus chrysippus TaxID=151541 RepID=A0A8J2QGW7_9NEOP|nr:unnamed protein product [Danaus chrysippus]
MRSTLNHIHSDTPERIAASLPAVRGARVRSPEQPWKRPVSPPTCGGGDTGRVMFTERPHILHFHAVSGERLSAAPRGTITAAVAPPLRARPMHARARLDPPTPPDTPALTSHHELLTQILSIKLLNNINFFAATTCQIVNI